MAWRSPWWRCKQASIFPCGTDDVCAQRLLGQSLRRNKAWGPPRPLQEGERSDLGQYADQEGRPARRAANASRAAVAKFGACAVPETEKSVKRADTPDSVHRRFLAETPA